MGENDVTLGEVSRKLDAFAADLRTSLGEIKADVRTKADATELANFRGELRSVHQRVAVLESQSVEARVLAASSAESETTDRQLDQRRLSIFYGSGLILVTLLDILVHVFVH